MKIIGGFLICSTLLSAPSLKISGSTTVNPIAAEAAEAFRKQGWRITVDTQGGSSGGLSALGEGAIDIAMSSRPVTDKDRKKFPRIRFEKTVIGFDGVALVVSKAIYDAGVRSLTRDQIRSIYEGHTRFWKDVGGPEKPIVFFNKEPGRGTWEIFAHFLYGTPGLAPIVSHPEVGGNEEGRTKVAGHCCAITQLSTAWADASSGVRALGIDSGGTTRWPTRDSILSGRYPIKRELELVTNGPPSGNIKSFIDYVLSPDGQNLVVKHGYLPAIKLS